MKNLDELGVQEMNIREMKEENGGFIGIAIALTVAFLLISQDAN